MSRVRVSQRHSYALPATSVLRFLPVAQRDSGSPTKTRQATGWTAGLLGAAGILALGLAFTVAAPTPAHAVICGDTDSDGHGAYNNDANDFSKKENTACGDAAEAGSVNGGVHNTAVGRKAEAGTAEGSQNTAIGKGSKAGTNTGDEGGGNRNTAVGSESGAGAGMGQQDATHRNVAIGQKAEANPEGGNDGEPDYGGATAVGASANANYVGAVAVGGAMVLLFGYRVLNKRR